MSVIWPREKFGNFLRPNSRPYNLGPDEDANLVGMRWYGAGPFHRELKSAMRIAKKSHFVIRAGDVIYNKLFAWKGSFGIVPPNLDRMFVSDKFPTYELDRTKVDEQWVRWYFCYPPLWDEAQAISTGSAAVSKLTLNPPKFLLLTMPLPPLAEQRRIVARIEELSAQINEARALRQQSARETDSLVIAQLRAISELLAKRHGTARLEDLIIEACYGSSTKCSPQREEGAVPVLRIPNVASERVQLDNLKFAHLSSLEERQLLLANGDILVVRTNGSLELVGRSAVVDELPEPMAFASYMIRLRFDTAVILPTYAQQMLQHLRVSGQLVDFARTSAGQYNVSLGRLRSAEIPVPPLPEQRQIAAELDTLQAEVDVLKSVQGKAAIEVDALMPSILDKAFRA